MGREISRRKNQEHEQGTIEKCIIFKHFLISIVLHGLLRFYRSMIMHLRPQLWHLMLLDWQQLTLNLRIFLELSNLFNGTYLNWHLVVALIFKPRFEMLSISGAQTGSLGVPDVRQNRRNPISSSYVCQMKHHTISYTANDLGIPSIRSYADKIDTLFDDWENSATR